MVTFNAITMVGTFPISIGDDDTVFSVKRRVALAAGYATDDVRLYNGSRGIFIDGDDRSFRDIAQEMNIQDGTPIHVILRIRAAGAKKRGSDHEESASKSRRLKMLAKKSAKKSVAKKSAKKSVAKKSAKNSKKSVRKAKKSARKVKKSAKNSKKSMRKAKKSVRK